MSVQVIVGANGSGKSTILKLVVRLYDPDEGQILLDGHDIRTLRMYDLRQAVSVLFQDYTHFPLSIRDNVALGDPAHFRDDARVHAALALGGAAAFVERLPEGAETYLDRPVRDYFSSMPPGTTTLFGRPVDYAAVRSAGRMAVHGGAGAGARRGAMARDAERGGGRGDAAVCIGARSAAEG